MKIILASKSPRRTEILSLMNVDHIIIPSTEENKFFLENEGISKKT